jgi:hypothetical protein
VYSPNRWATSCAQYRRSWSVRGRTAKICMHSPFSVQGGYACVCR